jgi:hypothetical protein
MRVRAPARITLPAARHGGLRISFVVPAGARAVRIQLVRGARPVFTQRFSASTPGARQSVKLTGAAFARKLRRGTYT